MLLALLPQCELTASSTPMGWRPQMVLRYLAR